MESPKNIENVTLLRLALLIRIADCRNGPNGQLAVALALVFVSATEQSRSIEAAKADHALRIL